MKFIFKNTKGFLAILLIAGLGACNSDTETSTAQNAVAGEQKEAKEAKTVEEVYNIKPTGKTNYGYEYIKHVDAPGNNIEPGEYAYFSYYVKMRDSIVGSSEGAELGRVRIDSLDAAATQQPSPVMDVMRLMSVGDSVTVYWPTVQVPQVPPEFKDEPFVVYELALKEIKNEEAFQADLAEQKKKQQAEMELVQKRESEVAKKTSDLAAKYKKGQLKSQLKETDTGLKYIIHEQGTGKQPKTGSTVLVQYYGTLTDGTMFDNSFKRGRAFNFPLGQGRVIPGWDEGIALLKEGAKATLFVPYQLAYGEAGKPPTIPEKSELIFYVELEKVY